MKMMEPSDPDWRAALQAELTVEFPSNKDSSEEWETYSQETSSAERPHKHNTTHSVATELKTEAR